MKLPNDFEYYLQRGIAKRITPDKEKAAFLVTEAETTLRALHKRVNALGIDADSANSIIKECYDIIIELARAKMLKEGYNSSGHYAHESEVSFLSKMGFSNNEVSFISELRYFRNSVTYYGKLLTKEYAEKVFEFLNTIMPKLSDMLRA